MKYFAPNLLPRNKWFRKRENLRKGDLVLEIEPTPRRTWKMGLVLETYPGEDGLVRKAKIKFILSSTNPQIMFNRDNRRIKQHALVIQPGSS